MRLVVTDRAQRDYDSLTANLKRRVDKQFELLLADVRHPSLRAKKYEGTGDVWQGRVDRSYRFFFQIDKDAYVILAILKHPK